MPSWFWPSPSCVLALTSTLFYSLMVCTGIHKSVATPLLGVCNLGACLSIERRDLHCHPTAGLISRVRIVVREDGSFEFKVVMRLKENNSISISKQLFDLCHTIDPAGGYKFCPGIDPSTYESRYLSVIRYDIKSVRKISDPIFRIDSKNCSLWHKLARNASIFEKDMPAVFCQPCKSSEVTWNVSRHPP